MAYARGVKLFPIEPGKPNQNIYIESFNGRFHDECRNEHWVSRAQKSLGGLMPTTYARELTEKALTLPPPHSKAICY
ncbi:hypothetical protein DID99_35555 [Burkholderia sp. Bp8986]|nr:hypothetical protein DID99_35555 [Burkholderia sp. Bp8986]